MFSHHNVMLMSDLLRFCDTFALVTLEVSGKNVIYPFNVFLSSMNSISTNSSYSIRNRLFKVFI